MKKLVVSKTDPCKACLSCVRACSEAFYKEFDPDLSRSEERRVGKECT